MFIETEDHIVLVTKFTVRLLLYAFGPGGCVCGVGGGEGQCLYRGSKFP